MISSTHSLLPHRPSWTPVFTVRACCPFLNTNGRHWQASATTPASLLAPLPADLGTTRRVEPGGKWLVQQSWRQDLTASLIRRWRRREELCIIRTVVFAFQIRRSKRLWKSLPTILLLDAYFDIRLFPQSAFISWACPHERDPCLSLPLRSASRRVAS